MPKDYEPFGIEWEKDMMKLSKAQLILILKQHWPGNNEKETEDLKMREQARLRLDFQPWFTSRDMV